MQTPGRFYAEIEVSTHNKEEYFEIRHLHALGEQFEDGRGHGSIQVLTLQSEETQQPLDYQINGCDLFCLRFSSTLTVK